MARSNPYRPFTPDPEQMALRPAVTGITINGLGESAQRPPRMVYWAPDPDAIPHGAMQRWFYQVDPGNPHLARARATRAQLQEQPMPDLQGPPAHHSPQQWARALKTYASSAQFEIWRQRLGAAMQRLESVASPRVQAGQSHALWRRPAVVHPDRPSFGFAGCPPAQACQWSPDGHEALGVVIEYVRLDLASIIEASHVQLALGHVNPHPPASDPVHRIGPSSYAGLSARGSPPKLPFGLVEAKERSGAPI